MHERYPIEQIKIYMQNIEIIKVYNRVIISHHIKSKLNEIIIIIIRERYRNNLHTEYSHNNNLQYFNDITLKTINFRYANVIATQKNNIRSKVNLNTI